MPDFRENGVIRCARLESKKSASGAVKKMCAAEWSRKMSRGGLIQPPPGSFRVKGLTWKLTTLPWLLFYTRVMRFISLGTLKVNLWLPKLCRYVVSKELLKPNTMMATIFTSLTPLRSGSETSSLSGYACWMRCAIRSMRDQWECMTYLWSDFVTKYRQKVERPSGDSNRWLLHC